MRDLSELVRLMRTELVEQHAHAVALAGSHARGDASELSDVDLYAIGDGPHYTLRVVDGRLVSVSWRTVAEERDALRQPAAVGRAVPGWRRARIVYDPAGFAAALQAEAIAFDWSTIAAECDAWVADQITGYAEEVRKLVAARRVGDLELAAIQRSILVLRLPFVLAVHLRMLFDSENRLWRMVSDAAGDRWAAAQAAALGLGHVSDPGAADRSALTLYVLAFEATDHLLTDEQRAVAEVAVRAASGERQPLPILSVPSEYPEHPTLMLMKGPPGSGKSSIARELGRRLRWPVIDKDVFRDRLADELGGLSYEAMFDLAERQLGIGLSVIADSPLGYATGYRRALDLAERFGAKVVVVECVCSDASEWRRRIEARAGTGLASHHATDWTRVEAFYERTAGDPFEIDAPRFAVDTAAPLERSVGRVINWLASRGGSTGPSIA